MYERTHSREIVDNSGLAASMPVYATFLVIFALSSVGLPGMNSFVGEFFVLLGTFMWSKALATVATLGVILAAAYILWMLQRVALGQSRTSVAARLPDLNWRETATLVPLVVIVLWVGLYPAPFLDAMDVSVTALIQQATGGLAVSQLALGP